MLYPYIASMGIYVFKTDVLLNLLKTRYPFSNDFGSEIIPAAVSDHNVQVRKFAKPSHVSYFFLHIYSGSNYLMFSDLQAYLFNDYWEDIGTLRSFFDANLALTEQVNFLMLVVTCMLIRS